MLKNSVLILCISGLFLCFACRGTGAPAVLGTEAILLTGISAQGAGTPLMDILAPYADSLEKQMSQPLAVNDCGMDQHCAELAALLCRAAENAITKHFSKNIRIDAVIFNRGNVRAGLPAGQITRGDVYTMLPFDNKLVIVTLPAKAVEKAMKFVRTQAASGIIHPVSGLGQTGSSRTGGKTLDKKSMLRILTSDFLLTGGDGMDFFAENVEVVHTGMPLRETFVTYLENAGSIPCKSTPEP